MSVMCDCRVRFQDAKETGNEKESNMAAEAEGLEEIIYLFVLQKL